MNENEVISREDLKEELKEKFMDELDDFQNKTLNFENGDSYSGGQEELKQGLSDHFANESIDKALKDGELVETAEGKIEVNGDVDSFVRDTVDNTDLSEAKSELTENLISTYEQMADNSEDRFEKMIEFTESNNDNFSSHFEDKVKESEGVFTVEEYKEEMDSALKDKLHEDTGLYGHEEGFRDEIDRTIQGSGLDNETTFSIGDAEYVKIEGSNLSEHVKDQVDSMDLSLTSLKDELVQEHYDLKDNVEMSDAIDFVENKYNGNYESISVNDDSKFDQLFIEFSESNAVSIEDNYQDSKADLVTAQEGFEIALSNGADHQELKDIAEKFGHEDSFEKAQINVAEYSENENVLKNIAENTDSEKVLDTLSKNESEEVRAAVASNENTSEETLSKMAETEKSEVVLEALKENPNFEKESMNSAEVKENVEKAEYASSDVKEAIAESKEGEKSGLSDSDMDKLRELDNKESKSLSDAIDIYKDGKFDNDSHGEKQGEHSSEKSGQKA